MPLLRYFLFVGGTLLALLFVADAALPTMPLPDSLHSGSDLPAVRIQSERKLPERVVFDTSVARSSQTPAAPVVIAQAQPAQALAAQAESQPKALAPIPPAIAEMSAKARVREAFAQLPPQEDASEPKMRQMATVVLPEPKMYPTRPQPKRKLAAKPRPPMHPMLIAQQPRPRGFFIW